MNPDDLRNWLSSTAAELRAHRWVLPAAAILIAAAIVIPLVLSKSGKPAPLSALPPAPSVTVPVPTTTAVDRHAPSQNYLTGPSHNPFVSSTSTSTSTTAAGTTTATSPSTSASSRSASVGTSNPAGGSTVAKTPSTVTVTTPARTKTVTKTTPAKDKAERYSNYEVELSLHQSGVSGAATVFHDVARDQLLPSDVDIIGAFLGVRTDGKTAVFVLTDDTSVSGEGRCAPSAARCEFLMLQPGDSVTLAVQPANGSASTFDLEYLKLGKVASSGRIVNVDATGAAEIKQASSYITQLQTASYELYTGLLSIDLGSTVPVNP